jgi:chemotaxis protein methyltransferase CheR
MTSPLNDATRATLADFVTAHLGLRFPPDRWNELEAGARAACRELGVPDVDAWVESLFTGLVTPAQLQTLANHLTVGETYFLRHGEVFRAFTDQLLPALFRERSGTTRHLRIWSAACSTGEEPYSIAMLLREMLPDYSKWHIELLASDVNTRSLAKAARGLYSEWSFRGAPAWVKQKYFKPHGRGQHELRPLIRDSVRFFCHNLVEDEYPARLRQGGFDFIFCRNALIYFSADWQQTIVQRFSDALTPDGHLILGASDTAPSLHQYFEPSPAMPAVYRSVKAGHAPQPAPAPSFPLWLSPAGPGQLSADHAEGTPSPTSVLPAIVDVPAITASLVATARQAADAGHLDAALEACDRAVCQEKLNPSPHFLRACILLELSRPAEAGAALQRVLFLDPEHAMAHFSLGSLDREQGHPVRAARHFREASRLVARINAGDTVPGSDGLTAARLQAVISSELARVEA